MREYRSDDGLTIRAAVALDVKGWQEVIPSAGPVKKEAKPEAPKEEPKEQKAEVVKEQPKEEPKKASGAVIKPKKG